MIVSELIAQLQTMPQDAPVIVNFALNSEANGRKIRGIEVLTACHPNETPECFSLWEWHDYEPENYAGPITVVNIFRSSALK